MKDIVFDFPLFTIILPLLGAVVCSVTGKKASKYVYFAVSLICAALSVPVLVYTLENGYFTRAMGHFAAPFGNEIRVGTAEVFFTLLAVLLPPLSVLGGKRRLMEDISEKKINFYFVMLCLLQCAITALAYTNDLFTAYVFIEISTLTSCGLLMIRQIGRTTVAAVRYMIFNLLGSGFVLMGICMLYDLTGYLSMSYIKEAVADIAATGEYTVPLTAAIGLIVIGIGMKSGMFPFHLWMPDTYSSSTTASACILSGLVSKGYIFLLIKIIYRVIGLDVMEGTGVSLIIFVFGLAGMIVGSLGAIRENEIRRMIAYSSAAQIGYIYMGIGIGGSAAQAAVAAAVFHIFTHALTKPLLFISASGLSDVSGGAVRFAALQGSAHRNPIAGAAFTGGALSMVGMPGFAGFISKLLFAQAAVASDSRAIITLSVLAISTILNAKYFLRTTIRIYLPPAEPQQNTSVYKNGTAFVFACAVLMAFNVFLGMHSQPILDMINTGIESLA